MHSTVGRTRRSVVEWYQTGVLTSDVVPWLVNVAVSELINIHCAGRCWISGGKFKCGFALCARVA